MKLIRRQRADPMLPGENLNGIADEFRITTRGENLVRFENDEMFVFGTRRNLTVLAHNRHWFADGSSQFLPAVHFTCFCRPSANNSTYLLSSNE